jgi:hypothetical protein
MALTLLLPDVALEDKTRRMYSMLSPRDFSDGGKARDAAQGIREGLPLSPTQLYNAFDAHLGQLAPQVLPALELCRDQGLSVLAAGSGPGFFTPVAVEKLPPGLLRELEGEHGVRALGCSTLASAEATAAREA